LKKATLILAIIFLFLSGTYGQNTIIKTSRGYFFSPHKEWAKWADSVLKTLPLRKQIGQMMMVAVFGNTSMKPKNLFAIMA